MLGYDDLSGLEMGRLAIDLAVGGLLALYIRYLFNRYSTSTADGDSISGVFPLLTLVTICVISVVKSSLALSLGLVGALSIVRFRAAIKDPEELVYLFLCIAVGLALGAGKLASAVLLVFAASVFIIGRTTFGFAGRRHNLMLTVAGDASRYFDAPEGFALRAVRDLAGDVTIQRYDVEDGEGLLRVVVNRTAADATASLIGGLREQLPGCRISYVNMDTLP
jgi:hypothetical protein